MKISKFRIKNYRSIVDSGYCYPAEGVTVFAGMNEAGKSSILEALEDFNVRTRIRDAALPIDQEAARPEIEIAFRIEKGELNALINNVPLNADRDLVVDSEVEITLLKKYPDKYEIGADSSRWLRLDQSVADRMAAIAAAHDRLIASSARAGY